jgi:MEDS: MEthanogen/methylotroph, DcmR Sensory domain
VRILQLPDEQYGVLLPFIKDGIEAAMQQVGTLDLRDWAKAHLQDGTFDPNRTRALIADIRQRSSQAGFPRTRFVTEMDWAVEARVSAETLLEYEARANLVRLRDPVVCAYDLSRFSGDVVIGVMRTHPMVMIGGILQENPFFVPPDEFLREQRGRHLAAPPPPLG